MLFGEQVWKTKMQTSVITLIASLCMVSGATQYDVPFQQDRSNIAAWAKQQGLKKHPHMRPSLKSEYYQGCIWNLPQCNYTKLRFNNKQLTSISMNFKKEALEEEAISFYRSIKKILTKDFGTPWFDNERSSPKRFSVPILRKLGQAAVCSWTAKGLNIQLRLDVGSTEGNALRLEIRPQSGSGIPPHNNHVISSFQKPGE